MGGGMGVSKNKHIEYWAYRRENAEYYFKFSRANWARLAVFGFGVPMAVYHLMTSEMVSPGSNANTFYKREYGVEPDYLFYPKNKTETDKR